MSHAPAPLDCRIKAICIALILFPFARRLSWPSLYADDAVRVAFLQTETLVQSLFRPFNEHLAPLFEVVGRLTWIASGRSLVNAPLAFTLVSFLPFLISLWLLDRLARLELPNKTAALAVVAVFGLSELPNEVVFWYSASSFTWAFCGILLAWIAAIRASHADSTRTAVAWSFGAAALAVVSPCFCGLGILAGPVAAVRLFLGGRRRLIAFVPMIGTGLYLTFVLAMRHRGVIMNSVGSNLRFWEGLDHVARAPFGVLIPSVVGLQDQASKLPRLLIWGLLALALVSAAFAPKRSMVLTSIFLILTAYGITYPFRLADDPSGVLFVQRYHLLPQAGLTLIVGMGWTSIAKDRRSDLAVLGLTILLLVLHSSGIRRHASFFRYPDQPQTLKAMEAIPGKASALGISRADILKALDPLRNAWTPDPRLFNTWQMLPTWDVTSNPIADPRLALLNAFEPSERESLLSGMDVGRYVQKLTETPASSRSGSTKQVSRMIKRDDGSFESLGPMSFLEIEWPADPKAPAALVWSGMSEGEIWWTDEAGAWASTRALTWAGLDAGATYRLPLSSIPHWIVANPPRIRLIARRPGPLRFTPPRLERAE